MTDNAAHIDTPCSATFQARGLVKRFTTGGQVIEVLAGVDFDLQRGEMTAIVGASGTGKTTLLHILGTLDRPDQGQLLHDDCDLFAKNDTDLSDYRNKTIGFVFQFHHLLPEFSTLENVMMPGLIAGESRQKLVSDANDILTQVGLAHRTTHRVGELSGGEQQRVALARALIMKPALLLADEPTGNLDTKTGREVFNLLQEMSSSFSLSVVMVTHNMELASRMGRCLTLDEGRLHAT